MAVTHALSYGMMPDSLTLLRSISRQRVPPRNSPLFAMGPWGGYAVEFVFWICVRSIALCDISPVRTKVVVLARNGLMWALSSGLTLFPCKGGRNNQRKDYSSFRVYLGEAVSLAGRDRIDVSPSHWAHPL
jgi:hypothetical protein